MEVENATRANELLCGWQKDFPNAARAYKPSEKTTVPAVAAMVFGSPFAGIASLVATAGAALLAALVFAVFSGMLMWFARRLPGLRTIAESHISPFMFLVAATLTLIVGAVTCGWAMGKLIAALGHTGKNRSAAAVMVIAGIGTFLLLFFGLWVGNMRNNPQLPELLRGWVGTVAGIAYAGIGAAMAATTGMASVAQKYFCEKCNRFMTPETWWVTQRSISAIRDSLISSTPCEPGDVRKGTASPGSVHLTSCKTCKCGYIDLCVNFAASWKQGETKQSLLNEWLTASKYLDAKGCRLWRETLDHALAINDREPKPGASVDGDALAADAENRPRDSVNTLEDTPIARVPCANCGAMMLPATADRTGGLCMPCHKSRQKPKRKRKNTQLNQDRTDIRGPECADQNLSTVVSVACPHCQSSLSIPADGTGRTKYTCPKCNSTFDVEYE